MTTTNYYHSNYHRYIFTKGNAWYSGYLTIRFALLKFTLVMQPLMIFKSVYRLPGCPIKKQLPTGRRARSLINLKELVHYWGNGYNWRKAEAQLNALPQFITNIDGVDIHFIHVRSKHPNALPLIISHGWPGSVFEFLKTIDPLTNPTAYGGKAEDAFDVVIPSLPGFGFSGKPTDVGWGPDRIAKPGMYL